MPDITMSVLYLLWLFANRWQENRW